MCNNVNEQTVCQCSATPVLPQFLYHGTNKAHAQLIKANGLGGTYQKPSVEGGGKMVTMKRKIWCATTKKDAVGSNGGQVKYEIDTTKARQYGEFEWNVGAGFWIFTGLIPRSELKIV